MVFQQDLCIANTLDRSNEHKRHLSFLTRLNRLRLVVTFDFHSDNARLVDNLLNYAAILADDLADEIARHMNRFLAVFEHAAGFFHNFQALKTSRN